MSIRVLSVCLFGMKTLTKEWKAFSETKGCLLFCAYLSAVKELTWEWYKICFEKLVLLWRCFAKEFEHFRTFTKKYSREGPRTPKVHRAAELLTL